jgi:hypothetical protein
MTLDIFCSSLEDVDQSNRWVVLDATHSRTKLGKVYNFKQWTRDTANIGTMKTYLQDGHIEYTIVIVREQRKYHSRP